MLHALLAAAASLRVHVTVGWVTAATTAAAVGTPTMRLHSPARRQDAVEGAAALKAQCRTAHSNKIT